MIDPLIQQRLQAGVVIPAHPLALDESRRLDERRHGALSRYYLASGAGGLAVGVHTTQFRIRDPEVGLYEPVLALAAEEMDGAESTGGAPPVRVGGICGAYRSGSSRGRAVASIFLPCRAAEPGRSTRCRRRHADCALS